MTRERFEQILFAHVGDEVVQGMLNQYVIELESSNAKLREQVRCLVYATNPLDRATLIANAAELWVEVDRDADDR